MSGTAHDHARAAYDVLAPVYDLLTAGHDHGAWAGQLEALAREAGLRGTRLLDLGCGTGLSMLPMRERGYAVTGVDVSGEMLARARARLGPEVRLELQDIRALPVLGAFDLVWSVADGFNCLLDERELAAAFAGVRRNLAPDGVLVFDVDTLASFRALYSSLLVAPSADGVVVFDGQAAPELEPDQVAEAIVERLQPGAEPPWWTRARGVHRQRHHSQATLERALAASGLELVTVWGTDRQGTPNRPLDEARHNKAVYLARAV